MSKNNRGGKLGDECTFTTPEMEGKMADERVTNDGAHGSGNDYNRGRNDYYDGREEEDMAELRQILAQRSQYIGLVDEYDDGTLLSKRTKRRIFFASVVLTMLGLLMVGCYYLGYRKASESIKPQLVTKETERVIKSGEAFDEEAAKRYMPEGGFSPESDSMMLSECYKSSGVDGFCYAFANDGEFLQYCQENYPEAVYPSNEWTVEEVLDSYRNSPEIWAGHENRWTFYENYLCWTPDYKHCFAVIGDWHDADGRVRSGWLLIDGVRVCAVDEQTYSLDPDTLVAKYRSGEWDGRALRSADFGTTAYLDTDQIRLSYSYQKYLYSPLQDPQGLAYDDYEEPWWYDPEEAAKYDVVDFGEYCYDDHIWSSIYVKVYPDLPDDYDVQHIVDTDSSYSRKEPVLNVLTWDGLLQRYSRTELLDEWDLMGFGCIDLKSNRICTANNPLEPGDVFYLRNGSRIYALKEGGEVNQILDGIFVKDDSAFDSLRYAKIFVLNDDGELWRYDLEEGKTYLLANGVLETNFDKLMAYRTEDGYYTLYRDYDQESGYLSLYLGTEPLEYYLDFWQNLEKANWRY